MTRASLVLAVWLIGCGGGAPGTGAVTLDEARDYCRDLCELESTCSADADPVDVCTEGCANEIDGWAREDAVDTIVDCLVEGGCDVVDDVCFAMVEPLPEHEELVATCRARMAECGLTPDDVDEFCGVQGEDSFALIAPEVTDELTACFDEECGLIEACLSAVVEAHGIDL